MKGVSEFVVVLIILIIMIASILVVWLFYNSMFGSVTTSGETSSLGETLSSCMKIDSASGNKIYLRNCGSGTIIGSALGIYIDDVPYNFSMNPNSIGKGGFGVINLYNIQNLSLGNHELRVASSYGEVKRYVKILSSYNPSDQVLYISFDEGSGNTTYDLTNYKNNGTLQNIYPLDVLASNPSLEAPWYSVNNQDSNHRIQRPYNWTVGYSYSTASKMQALQENSIVNDGSSAIHMAVTTGSSFMGSLEIDDCNYRFPIDETKYLEGGNFYQAIKGTTNYGDKTFLFYNSTGDYLSRRWASDYAPLTTDLGDGWYIQSYIWQPSSGDPNQPTVEGDISYIPKGAKYACFKQYYDYQTQNVDKEAVFDKFFVYQWDSTPSDAQRFNRASSGWTDGKFGKALYFDGVNDYVQVPSNSLFQGGNMKTLEAWVKPSSLSASQMVLEKGDTNLGTAERGPYYLAICNDGRVVVDVYDTTATANGFASSSVLSPNNWYFLALVINTSEPVATNQVKLYINGIQETRNSNGCQLNTASNLGTIRSNTQPLFIGIRDTQGTKSLSFSGIIDDVRIWNRSLSQAEIQSISPLSLTLGETS